MISSKTAPYLPKELKHLWELVDCDLPPEMKAIYWSKITQYLEGYAEGMALSKKQPKGGTP